MNGVTEQMSKNTKKMEQAVLIDMNVTMIANTERHVQGLSGSDAILDAVINATNSGIEGLDELFHDGGMARKDIVAIPTGFLRDATDLDGTALADRVDQFVNDALKYLRSHRADFKNI